MKKLRSVWLTAVSLLLAGCGTALSAEEVASRVAEKAAEVQTYRADIQFDIYAESLNSDEILLDSKTAMEMTMNEETLDNYGTVNVDSMGETVRQAYYSISDQAFMNVNDMGWQDVSDMQSAFFQNEGTLYEALVPIIRELAEEAEMTVEDGSYVFSFKGTDAELFEAFALPYQLQAGDIPPEEMQQQVVAKVDQETFFIQSIDNLLTGEGSNRVHFYLSHRYEDINDVGEFVIPAEVMETAQGNQQ